MITYFFYILLMIEPPSEHFSILDHIILSLSGHIQVGATFAWSIKHDLLSVMRCVLKKIKDDHSKDRQQEKLLGFGCQDWLWIVWNWVPTFGKWSVSGLGNLSRCWEWLYWIKLNNELIADCYFKNKQGQFLKSYLK